MIRVLHVVGCLDSGGVEALLLRYYQHWNRSDIQWTCITPVDKNHVEGLAERQLRELGVEIEYMPRKNPHFLKQLFVFNRLLGEKKYEIIHSHIDEFSAFYLFIAKLHGVKVRIAHCHIAHTNRGKLFEFLSRLSRPLLSLSLTDRFACSLDAAEFLFGKDSEKCYIMKNAIEPTAFLFSEKVRNRIRQQYKILDHEIIVGCVARFSWQKNHEFLINIFNAFCGKMEARLLLVGNGPLEQDLKAQAARLGIMDKVIFAGVTSAVFDYLSAMDVFVLPSRYEGLGIVYIEAQSMKLPTFATDERVPHEVAISPNMHFVSEKASPEFWAEEIRKALLSVGKRDGDNGFVAKAGYDIRMEADKLAEKYTTLYNQTKSLASC